MTRVTNTGTLVPSLWHNSISSEPKTGSSKKGPKRNSNANKRKINRPIWQVDMNGTHRKAPTEAHSLNR